MQYRGGVNARPEDQRQLLDIALLETKIRRAEHARTHPAEADRISALAAQRTEQAAELTRLTGVLEDTRTELDRLESDVTLATQRRDRNAQRLAESISPKDAQALEHEVASLERRLSDLEDTELDVMARVEDAEAAVAAQQALIDQTTAEGTALTARAKAAVAAASAEVETLGRDRAAIASALPADLVAEYERRAARGVGAGLLRRGTCEGCQMMLPSTELNRIRQAAEDEILSCPECGGILVRTEESGL